jgi:hypothetical protein
MTELDPLIEQFKYTPWVEIPKGAQDRIKFNRAKAQQKRRAEAAIQQKVPVSQIELACSPGFPNCDDLADPSNKQFVGAAYTSVLHGQLADVMNASAAADGSGLKSIIQTLDPNVPTLMAASLLWKAISEETHKEIDAGKQFSAFLALLPRSAVIPQLKYPQVPADPISCQGVYSRARGGQ